MTWHELALQRAIKLAEAAQAAFDVKEAERVGAAQARGEMYVAKAYPGGNGFMLSTPNGSFTYNPHWVARNKHAASVDKFLASFGMSPSSRGRVSPSRLQGDLFHDEQKDAWNKV